MNKKIIKILDALWNSFTISFSMLIRANFKEGIVLLKNYDISDEFYVFQFCSVKFPFVKENDNHDATCSGKFILTSWICRV